MFIFLLGRRRSANQLYNTTKIAKLETTHQPNVIVSVFENIFGKAATPSRGDRCPALIRTNERDGPLSQSVSIGAPGAGGLTAIEVMSLTEPSVHA